MFISSHVEAPIELSERGYYIEYFIIIDLIGVTRRGWRILAESPSRVCKIMENSPNLRVYGWSYVNTGISPLYYTSIKHFSKRRYTTLFICFHVKGPIDLSEGMYYLKDFIIIDLVAVTWVGGGWEKFSTCRRQGFGKLWKILPICETYRNTTMST